MIKIIWIVLIGSCILIVPHHANVCNFMGDPCSLETSNDPPFRPLVYQRDDVYGDSWSLPVEPLKFTRGRLISDPLVFQPWDSMVRPKVYCAMIRYSVNWSAVVSLMAMIQTDDGEELACFRIAENDQAVRKIAIPFMVQGSRVRVSIDMNIVNLKNESNQLNLESLWIIRDKCIHGFKEEISVCPKPMVEQKVGEASENENEVDQRVTVDGKLSNRFSGTRFIRPSLNSASNWTVLRPEKRDGNNKKEIKPKATTNSPFTLSKSGEDSNQELGRNQNYTTDREDYGTATTTLPQIFTATMNKIGEKSGNPRLSHHNDTKAINQTITSALTTPAPEDPVSITTIADHAGKSVINETKDTVSDPADDDSECYTETVSFISDDETLRCKRSKPDEEIEYYDGKYEDYPYVPATTPRIDAGSTVFTEIPDTLSPITDPSNRPSTTKPTKTTTKTVLELAKSRPDCLPCYFFEFARFINVYIFK